MLGSGVALAERGLVPTPLLRRAIRRLCEERLAEVETAGGVEAFLARLDGAPIAVATAEANAQHYEVASDFFQLVLGGQLKYSSCLYEPGTATLDAAEEAMLSLTSARAQLADGQSILELGCGWGSLSLWMARRYPNARITAVSNSATQRAFIESRRPPNLEVRTADINGFDPGGDFDRVVSVEMFEHLRDWRTVLERVAGWLRPEGKAFIHVFCHAREAYPFEVDGEDNWMGRYFFTGGIMPSFDLLPRVAGALEVEERWWVDGTHYQRTAAAWRRNLEARREPVMRVLRAHYGTEASRWYQRWRMFFLACEELFGYRDGQEWGVGHYRLSRRGDQ
jgi:cyclopropane-fatty-acyl-phospholipid synthase